jgi:hypothetical protein
MTLPDAAAVEIKAAEPTLATGALIVQAASATSTRLQNEPCAYNLITIEHGRIGVEVHAWDGSQLFAAVRPVATESAAQNLSPA